MADPSTIDSPVDISDPIYSFDDWNTQFSDESLSFEEKLPSYVDYLRTSFFKRGELTEEVETSLMEFYADQIVGEKEVSNEEYQQIASNSSAFSNRSVDDDIELIRATQGEQAANLFLSSNFDQKLDASNKAREILLNTGDIPYATITMKEGFGVVRSGNYGQQDFEGAGRVQSERAAIEAVGRGVLDPRDLWQVSKGLESAGMGGRTNFQIRQDDEINAIFNELLKEEADKEDKPINDLITSYLDLESYKGIKPSDSWFAKTKKEFEDKGPESIDQIITAEDKGEGLEKVQKLLLDRYIKQKNLQGVETEDQIRGLLGQEFTYSEERIKSVLKEIATRHANLQGVFQYFDDSKDDKKNIRITDMGSVIAHPNLMSQRKRFDAAVEADDRLSDSQREMLKEQRKLFMQGRVDEFDNLFTEFKATEKSWDAAKANNPGAWNNNTVDFIDDFIAKKVNYKAVSNRIEGFKSSVKDAVLGFGHSFAALLGREKSADYLVAQQRKQSQRKKLAAIFSDKLGLGYDITTTLAPMVTDLGATVLISRFTGVGGGMLASAKTGAGVTARATNKGLAKLAVGSLFTVPAGKSVKEAVEIKIAKNLIDKSGKEGATAAINAYNKLVQNRYNIRSSMFLTSANRSAGGMYGTIYGALPDDMSHEEKHDKALGHSLLAGALTGSIVTGMSAIGRGGVEDVLLRGMSYGNMKRVLNKIADTDVGGGVHAKFLEKYITRRGKDLQKSLIPTGIMTNALNEGIEEGVDEFVNSFVQDSALDEKTPLRDKIMQAFHAAQIGAVMGGTVPALSASRDAINKLRGVSTVNPDLFLSGEIEKAITDLQKNGSPLSAEELRKRFTQAARDQDTEVVTPPTEPDTPTVPMDEIPLEDTIQETSIYIEQLQQFLNDPENNNPPVIPFEYLNFATQSPDFNVAKDGTLLGILNEDGVWIGKDPNKGKSEPEPEPEPEPDTEPDTEPDAEPEPEPEPETYLPGAYKYGTDFWSGDVIPPKELGIGTARTKDKDFITVSEQELQKISGVRKALKQWVDGNKESLNKLGVLLTSETKTGLKETGDTSSEIVTYARDVYTSRLKGAKFLGSVTPGDIIITLNPTKLSSSIKNAKEGNRKNALYAVIAEELIHANEQRVIRDAFIRSLKDQGRDQSDENTGEFDAFHKKFKHDLFRGMTNEQIAAAADEYNYYFSDPVKKKSASDVRTDLAVDLLRRLKKLDRSDPDFIKKAMGAINKVYNEKFYATNMVAEFVRQVIQLRKGRFTTESFKQQKYFDPGTPLRSLSVELMNFVNKLIKYTKQMLSNAELDPTTQNALLEHVIETESRLAEFFDIQFNKALPKDPQKARAMVEKIVKEEEEASKDRVIDEEEDIASIMDNPIIQPDIDKDFVEANRNPASDLDIDQTEQRLVSFINAAKYSSGTFGIQLEVDETVSSDKGAFYTEGERMFVNPYGLHNLIDGLRDEDAESEIDSEIVRQAASIASYRRISQESIDRIAADTSASDYDMIIGSLPESEQQQSRERLMSQDPAVVKAERERLVEKRMNDFASRLLRGHTVDQDRIFFQGNPGWISTGIYFLEGLLNRVWSSREVRKENPYLSSGIDQIVQELRIMKGGYRIPKTNMEFDSRQPAATMNALYDTIEEDDTIASAAREAEDTEEPKPPFRIKNVLSVLEVPVYEIGAYKKPPAWLRKLKLASEEDPRLRQINEMRSQYYRMVNNELKEYKKIFDNLVVETYGSIDLAPTELIAKATGSTRGLMLEDDVREQIDSDYFETLETIRSTYADNATVRDALIEKAQATKNERIAREQLVRKRKVEAERERALAIIEKDSKALATHLGSLRSKIDDLSREIGELIGEQNPQMKAHIDSQLGIYLTRSYKIFSEENWIDDVLTKEEHRELRDSVKKEFLEFYTEELAKGNFERKEREFQDDREASWNLLSYTGKMQQAMDDAKKEVQAMQKNLQDGKDLSDLLMRDFLENYRKSFWDTGSSEEHKSMTDILKRKKNLPKFMRQLLGEFDSSSGDFNLMKTFMNVGTLAANLAMTRNLVTVGRRGEKKDYWFLTNQEIQDLKDTDPERYEEIANGPDRWIPVRDPSRVDMGRGSGINKYDPLTNFIDENNVNRGILFAPPSFVEDFNKMLDFNSKSNIEETRVLDSVLRKGTGLALAAKTLGSIPFYIRNIVSNVLFFGPAQGVLPLNKMFGKRDSLNYGGTIREELRRKFRTPEAVDAYASKLIKLGVLDNELTSQTLQALSKGKMSDKDILNDLNTWLDKEGEQLGLSDVDVNTKAGMRKLKNAITNPVHNITETAMEKLRDLSEVVDTFYKIAYYETELNTLKKAKEQAGENDRLADMSDENLEQEAARKIKMTAQSYSQAPPIVDSVQNSTYGVLFAPFFRFKLEVPRIMFNTYKLGLEEVNSGNSVLMKRGWWRMTSMTGVVGGFSMLAKSLGEKAVVAILNAFGQDAEDDELTTEQEHTLRLGSPSFLRSHTFYFYKLDGKLKSLDLTYVNPFAMYADAVPRAWEHIIRGDEEAAISTFIDTAVALPFLDSQIAASSVIQATNNQDENGDPLWKSTDNPFDKMFKGAMHVVNKAYMPPTLDRLKEMKAATEAGRSSDFLDTPFGMIFNEFIPFKPYTIDPSQVKFRIFQDLKMDSDISEDELRKILSGKLMTTEDIESIVDSQGISQKRIGEAIVTHYKPLRELGVSAEEMEDTMKRFLTNEQFEALSSEAAMQLKTLTPSMLDILRSSPEQDVRNRELIYNRAFFEKYPDGKVYLDDPED